MALGARNQATAVPTFHGLCRKWITEVCIIILKTAALWQTARQFWISEMILQQQWMNAVKSQNSTVPDAAHICDWDSCL